jgi:hypothetical protein
MVWGILDGLGKNIDVELTGEITFWIWTWKMESYRCLFLLNSANSLQTWDCYVIGLTKHMMTRLNTRDEGNMPSIRIARLVSAFHCPDGISSLCEAGIA